MTVFHDAFSANIDAMRAERRELLDAHGAGEISRVTVAQAVGGMRGVRGLVCDTSEVDPDRGLIIRGTPVLDLADHSPEAVFFLLLAGRLPDDGELDGARAELARRAAVPEEVWPVVQAMPSDSHPMAMLSAGVVTMDRWSHFREAVSSGIGRDAYWSPALDDGLDLIARLPALAAGVYRMRYGKGARIAPDPDRDWAAAFCRMLGVNDPEFDAAMRMATVLQSDHEGGNVCAFACHTVGSVLSNPFLAVAAGFNGLAGPLHGLASQDAVAWIMDAVAQYGGTPSDAEAREYAEATLDAGRVIPGYGHAVLRGADPRFTALSEFGRARFRKDAVFDTVLRMADVVPDVLSGRGKAKNPNPNVDAVTGSVWHHFGITEQPFYTVPFAVSLALGMVAQYVINRALGTPITRPRSISTQAILREFGNG